MRRAEHLLLAGALFASACTTARQPPREAVPPAPAALGAAEIGALAELLRMEDERALDSARVAADARHAHPEVRARAALAAGRIGDARALPLLLALLADEAPRVRAAAVFALGELGDTSAVVTERLAAMLPAAEPAALEVPAALGKLGTRAAAERLRALLAAGAQPPLLVEALLASWRFGPELAGASVPFLGHRDARVRWAATYALARGIAPAAAMPRALELLGDADPLVRATAVRALKRAPVDSAGLAPAVRAALAAALRDAHEHVRINATRALAAFRVPEDAEAIAALLEDGSGHVRVAAAEALATLPAAAPALRATAERMDAPLALRSAALASLLRVDSAGAKSIAESWSASPQWLQRFYAARALGALRWPSGSEALLRLARDSDPRVQGEAFGALAGADSAAQIGAVLLEGLASPDPIVRAGAASGLGRRRDPAFLSALMQAYDRAQRDPVNDAALAALDALDALAERDVPVARTFFLRFPVARDPIVRARAAQHFGTGAGSWGEPRPIRTGRDPAFYELVVRELVVPAVNEGVRPVVAIRTSRGDITLELAAAEAPLTVHNFITLIRRGFYAAQPMRWHRVVPNFVLQDGDPRGDGSGGPPGVIRDEINPLRYERGVLGMALSGPDTGGSQFFITHSPQPHLDGGYTIFGRVIAGMEVADAILQDDAILGFEVVR